MSPQLEPWQWPEEHWRKLVEPGARRPHAPAQGLAGRRALRGGAVVRLRPRDQRAARRRQVDRPPRLGPVRQPGRRAAHPASCSNATTCKATFYVPAVTALLHPDEQRALVAEGHEIGIHGWIHELNSVLPLRGRTRPDAALGRHAGEDHRHAPGRHAHAVLGFQPATRSRSRRRWGCSTTPR